MIEIPEGMVLAEQLDKELKNKRIKCVIADSTPHKFTWYEGNPADYEALFQGKEVEGAYSYGGKLYIKLNEDCEFMFCEGTNIRYYVDDHKLPEKHQLFIAFDDSTYLICSVRMYGAIYGYRGILDNEYDKIARIKPSVFSDEFDLDYFRGLLAAVNKPKLSAKTFLATEQRIPGLGNGVVQDILFNAGIHPKRNMETLSTLDMEKLFYATKDTILEMTQKGGRDAEKDIYGNPGGYKTIMSKNSYKEPCPRCGGEIKKESYMGGSVYYCKGCQV